ncbi:TPA: restriction endonuclease [Burkholderia cenocepacia]|uniref:restriction endonuclease n=1 Tax=Burkholderia cenocepacia TaxID=95486 RepID=UPI002AB710A5|nr:restriction endonuclease [Burkholderia cenocepacia]
MASTKGPELEELVRAYFARQGFFAIRSVPLQYESEDVTDIDVWVYGRQAASARTRMVVDAKNKRSPKAFERIMWVRGLQAVLGCDRAIVATTDGSPAVTRFAQQQKVAVLTRNFLERLEKRIDVDSRLSLEQFIECIEANPSHKQDGEWLRRISDAKAALTSLPGFPAFNRIMAAFAFFAERVETRAQHREQAVRAALFCAALACVALDGALERLTYASLDQRLQGIMDGVAYGDSGDGRAQSNIDTVLAVVSENMPNGRVVAAQARGAFDKLFSSIRADVIAEFFAREANAGQLFNVAKELDDCAHAISPEQLRNLSTEARSVIGVFCDFVGAKRSLLQSDKVSFSRRSAVSPMAASDATTEPSKPDHRDEAQNEETSGQHKLL